MFKSKIWEVNEYAHKGVFKKLGSGKPEIVRNVKNSTFFLFKRVVILIIYIIFVEIINI